jgi:hypothetical protein
MVKMLFEYSPLWLLPMALIGFGLAWWLYSKKGPWSNAVSKGLFVLRGLVFTLLAFMLLGPMLRQIENIFVKPEIIIAYDNSLSIAAGTDEETLTKLNQALTNASKQWQDKGFAVRLKTLDANFEDAEEVAPSFEARQTNLHFMLKEIEDYARGRNLKKVLLISDGLTNLGANPEYQLYGFPISTIALGDTIPRKDVVLQNLRFNKVSYKGSLMSFQAEISQNGYDNQNAVLRVSRQGQEITSVPLRFGLGESFKTIDFLIEAEREGLQNFLVEVLPLQDEFSTENNQKMAFVEVVESKRKILLAAAAPHPDIKALRSMLESTESFELVQYIAGIDQWQEGVNFDLAILHQIPARNPALNEVLARLPATLPRWYFLGSLSDLRLFGQQNGLVGIIQSSTQLDRVFPQWNERYDRFIFDRPQQMVIGGFPPVAVPFGNYDIAAEAEILLYQRVGSVVTDRPLLLTGTANNVKTAVMVGDGLWTWRLENRKKEGKEFDELFSKLIQYLAAKEDNRKFRFYSLQNEWDESDAPVFESEAYNDILERIYNYEITIELRNEADSLWQFSYAPSPNATRYRIPNLPAGLYRYRAQATLQGNPETDRGEFIVQKREIELNNLTANYALMRSIASRHEGRMFTESSLDEIASISEGLKASQRIYTKESYMSANRLYWIFLLLVLLASVEWFLRKYYGGY